MWQSFRAIGRGSSENGGRKKRKHHEHFIRPPVTTVHGRPNKLRFTVVKLSQVGESRSSFRPRPIYFYLATYILRDMINLLLVLLCRYRSLPLCRLFLPPLTAISFHKQTELQLRSSARDVNFFPRCDLVARPLWAIQSRRHKITSTWRAVGTKTARCRRKVLSIQYVYYFRAYQRQ